MYNPRIFRRDEPKRLQALIDDVGFGLLVVSVDGDPEIAHLPFVLDRDQNPLGTLITHVARPSEIWRYADGRPVTVVFQGPHAYVSASYYEEPSEQVPTMNYVAVHARGRAVVVNGTDTLVGVRKLAAHFERREAKPWSTDLLSDALRQELLEGIVGIEIRIEHLEGKVKVSQNRAPEDRARVRRALVERGEPNDLAIVRFMDEESDRRPPTRALRLV